MARAIADDAADRRADVLDIERVEVLGGVAAGLGQRRRAGGDDRHAAQHRLDEHEPEALVERRMHERVGAAHQRVEAGVGQVAGQPHGLAAGGGADARGLGAAVDARQHEPVLEPLHAQQCKRLDEAQQVLLRAQVADREQVGTVVRHGLVADRQRRRVRDHPHALLVDAVAPHDVGGGVARARR